MSIDDEAPNPDDPLTLLMRQDIDRLSVAELDARIESLKAEIERVAARRTFAINHKASADSLFKR